MCEQLPSALDLFNRFRSKFEQVDLIPLNLIHSHWMFASKEMNFLYLQLGRAGTPFHHKLWPTLDLAKAGVKFVFNYDGTKDQSMWNMLNQQAIAAVNEQVLKGRTFTMRPENPTDMFDTSKSIKLKVAVEGDPIPGLNLAVKTVCGHDWGIFVPTSSPEGLTI